ncbi:MAG: hypothetical protein MUO62_11650 [Anaerolineales bacterium]|nr:hypothetical protein [Anaerolineales bacterium]
MNTSPVILGFNIGGTKTAVVLGTFDGEILQRRVFPTNANLPFEAAFEQIIRQTNNLIAEAKAFGYPQPEGSGNLRGVLINCPLAIPR